MRRKGKIFMFLFLSLSLSFFISNRSLSAEKTVSDMISEKFSEKRDICLAIISLIQEGKDTKEVVKTSIKMGYSVCFVIRCAEEGGGNPEQILSGAVEAAAKPEAISKCPIDTMKKPEEVPAAQSTGVPEWKILALGMSKSIIFYDKESIIYPSSDIARVRTLEVYPEEGEYIYGKKVKEDMVLWEIRCPTKELRVLQSTQYDSSRNVLKLHSYKLEDWRHIVPGSIAAGLYQIVCPQNKNY